MNLPLRVCLCALLTCGVAAGCCAQEMKPKRLPKAAILHLGGSYLDEKRPMERRECRREFRVTTAQVRHRFAAWHEISGMEYDLGAYVYLNCGRSGTAIVNGKTYTWSVHPEDTMTTDWPDGQLHWYVRELLDPDV